MVAKVELGGVAGGSPHKGWAADRLRLAAALENSNPRRAHSGRLSFHGFVFQVHSALLNYVKTLSPADLSSAPQLNYESLADFAIEDQGLLYTFEAKRSLSRNTLESALRVLKDVYVTATNVDPDLAENLRFQISCWRSTLADPIGSAQKWALTDQSDAAAAVVAHLAIDTVSDPLGALYAILASDFRVVNPQRTVDTWVRHIVDDVSGRSRISTEIVNSLSDADHEDFPFVILSAEDQARAEVVRNATGFLTGEQPTLKHLRNGYFAPHEDIDEIEDQFWSWYEQTTDDSDIAVGGFVPVYWIGGSSGSGKSILTLQLLSRLNASANTTVLWLGGAVDKLQEAMRFAKQFAMRRTVIIGVDDPFVSAQDGVAHWKSAMAELTKLRHKGDLDMLPIIVCCGTAEQFERFRQSCSEDVTCYERMQGPPSRSGLVSLRRWFTNRTGFEANLYEDGDSVLPAQLFFEWSKREGVRFFARRFRTRLSEMSDQTIQFVESVLALNRIYVGYPSASMAELSPAVRDDLHRLEEDLHFGFRDSGRMGYWLSHPHLANLLYNTWFPPEQHFNKRASHLTAVLGDLIAFDVEGRRYPRILFALAGTAEGNTDGHRGVGRLAAGELELVADSAAQEAARDVATLGMAALAGWIRLETAVGRAFTEWSPRAEAISRIREAESEGHGMMLTIRALLASASPDALTAVHEFAARNPLSERWSDMMRPLLDKDVDGLIDSLVIGVEASRTDQGRIDLLERALANHPGHPELRALARHLLLDADVSSKVSLGRLALAVVNGPTQDRIAVIDWLLVSDRRENGPVLAAVQRLRNAPIAVLDLIRKWLLKHPEQPTAEDLFTATLTWTNLSDRVFRAALTKHLARRDLSDASPLVAKIANILAANQHHTPWSYAYQECLASLPSSARIRTIGREWLDHHRGNRAWYGTWTAVANVTDGVDPELADLGDSELVLVTDSETWPIAMRLIIMLSGPDERAERVDRAMEWLEVHQGSAGGWGYLFTQIVSDCGDSELTSIVDDVAIPWLRHNPRAAAWRYVWIATFARATSKRTLTEIAMDWLTSEAARNDDQWPGVLRALWREQGPEARLRTLAFDWLSHSHSNRFWPAIFGLTAESMTREQVVILLTEWFAVGSDVTHYAIGYLWKVIVDDELFPTLPLEADLRPSLEAWLMRAGNQDAWWHVWSWIHRAIPTASWPIKIGLSADLPLKRSHGVANQLGKSARADPEVANVLVCLLSEGRERQRSRAAIMTSLEASSIPGCDAKLFDVLSDYIQDLESEFFAPVWKHLWGNAESEYRVLMVDYGINWCEEHFDNLAWGGVWVRMFDSACTRKRDLHVLGEKWLADPRSNASRKRGAVVTRLHSSIAG
ncbi:hypothetical protein AB0K11_13425 [Mycobacterium sp. NPDC050551]|uniref:hypothetical protein n=1 Tax=Mycobacterium sp. NPDC050551 TaxID=3155407 RepID=UPI003432E64F